MSPARLITPVVQRWLDDARRDPEGFWDRAARGLPWFRTWDRTFEWTPPTFRWFIGGETNLCYNAIDRHVEARGDQIALVAISTETNDTRSFTYRELLREVNVFASVLKSLGVSKGERDDSHDRSGAGGKQDDRRQRWLRIRWV